VGIEIERKYWEIAVRRVRAELEQLRLFQFEQEPAVSQTQLKFEMNEEI